MDPHLDILDLSSHRHERFDHPGTQPNFSFHKKQNNVFYKLSKKRMLQDTCIQVGGCVVEDSLRPSLPFN